ncbi:hypothetical protein [Granulosicoccus antarcticus]|uniref:TonB C-terminal domain-containing protein n=1 Tax=Granulosicoccus antarcticus IMCC3135 TaxID=1192854 RepID=A0A2Z2P2M0_9GAMM|nr:hypothetical protein [Granulosicoccus antarcticus]ASJ73944.1 hypothetical protein IMCC3135_19325 [Granulosicoccus antarcticus IMCC3135]
MKYISFLILLTLGGCALGDKPIMTHEGYVKALDRQVSRNMYLPEGSSKSYDCRIKVSQDQEGNVISSEYGLCEADDALIAAFDKAIMDASPLPLPDDMALFDSEIVLRFCPGCE